MENGATSKHPSGARSSTLSPDIMLVCVEKRCRTSTGGRHEVASEKGLPNERALLCFTLRQTPKYWRAIMDVLVKMTLDSNRTLLILRFS